MNYKTICKFGDELHDAGLTPFDLVSWVFLLDLLEATKSLPGLDMDVRYKLHEEILAATKRKADFLDSENGTDFYNQILRSFENV